MAEPSQTGAPGAFYVDPDCCLLCGVPVDVAPDIFGWADDDSHCLVKRQPQTDNELDRTLRALWSSELSCIRYRGGDRDVARRIAQFGRADCCDEPPEWWVRPVRRDRVAFTTAAPERSAADLAGRFRAFLERSRDEPFAYAVDPPEHSGHGEVRFSWTGRMNPPGVFHTVAFESASEDGRCRAKLRAGDGAAHNGLALIVHDWLRGEEGASDVRWHSHAEARSGARGLHMPI